jgi:hypothetical protein
MAISDVITQLTTKVKAKDQVIVLQIVQNAHDNLCLSYGLDLTNLASGLKDAAGNPVTVGQALNQLGAVVTPARVQAAVLAALQNAVAGIQ